MERFAVWLRRQGNRQVPTSLFALGMACMTPGMILLPVTMTFGMADNPQEATLKLVGLAALGIAGWIPMALNWRKTRNEVRIVGKGFVGSVNHWKGKLGRHAEQLEEAAIDLEQIEGLAGKTSLEPGEAQKLTNTASARLWRMFELSVAAPARHGLTLEQAEVRIAEDARWISELRHLVERSTETSQSIELDNSLATLREIVDARENAVEELRAR